MTGGTAYSRGNYQLLERFSRVKHSQTARLRVGLLVNPWAGVGGSTGLRGSDGADTRDEALARGALQLAPARAGRCLDALDAACIDWLAWAGDMGADLLAVRGITVHIAGTAAHSPSTGEDTRGAAAALLAAGIDVLLFAGGDGTARDVCAAVGRRVPVLGIPAGVKMYSGVFAVSPEAAAGVVARLAEGLPVELQAGEVRDIDEDAFREDRVASRWYGEMDVPGVRGLVQHVKCSAPPVDELARAEIAAGVVEHMEAGTLYLVGTGTTPAAVMEALRLPASLLGVDAVLDRRVLAANLDAAGLLALLAQYPRRRLLLTATGGQGFLLGRGNQQLSAAVIAALGADNLDILLTPEKLAALEGRPLLVDTGDVGLDLRLAGLRVVRTGYEERLLYRVEAASAVST